MIIQSALDSYYNLLLPHLLSHGVLQTLCEVHLQTQVKFALTDSFVKLQRDGMVQLLSGGRIYEHKTGRSSSKEVMHAIRQVRVSIHKNYSLLSYKLLVQIAQGIQAILIPISHQVLRKLLLLLSSSPPVQPEQLSGLLQSEEQTLLRLHQDSKQCDCQLPKQFNKLTIELDMQQFALKE